MEKVKFGLSNVHIAKRIEAEGGAVSYETPVEFPGAVNLTLEPQAEEINFYADNVKYWNEFFLNSYSAEFECAMVHDFFKTGYLGFMADTAGHLVETNARSNAFALMFQVETDVSNKKYAIYNVIASKPNQEYATVEESTEPQTSTLTLSISGEKVGDVTAFITEVDSFSSLALPTFASI